MKEFLKNVFKGLTIGVSLILGILLVVYRASITKLDTKTSGQQLTLTNWNTLVNTVNQLIDKVDALGSQNSGYSLPTEITAEQPTNTLAGAIAGCKALGGGWRLPTQEELSLFIGRTDIGTITNLLWTRTLSPYGATYWAYLRLSDGYWNSTVYNGSIYYRCVR